MSVSPEEELRKGIAILKAQDLDDDDKIDALETIMDFCNSVDYAMGKFLFWSLF